MLQDIRQQIQGTTAKIVVGVIVVTFAFFGIESILVSGGGNEIAEVNGESIYPQDLQVALDTQRRRLIAMMGENFDPALLDEDRLRPQALEALINRELLMQSASALKLGISEAEIGQVVAGMDEFKVDGVFSPSAYKSVLANAGYTPSLFKDSLRDDIVLNQLRSGIAGSDFVTPSELLVNAQIMAEQRDLRYLTIPREKFGASAAFSEEQIENYYQSHQDVFRTPESVDIDYLKLTLDDFRQPVEESAIREAYEAAALDAQYQTQNRISHILFQDNSESSVAERIAQAQKELADGTSFAEVAKKYSDDRGSADKGGDLGFSSGQTFPDSIESALTSLEPGIVSAPVKTDAGMHLLLVTERKQGEKPSFEEMRAQLEESIQAEEARVALVRSVESLKDLSFNSEDLAYPAKELGLTIESVNGVTRSQNEGLFSNPALLEAAFSDDVFSAGHNSEVIELKGDQFVVLRVRNHNAAEVKPLAAVKENVIAALAEETARAAVATEAAHILEKLHSGTEMEQLPEVSEYNIQVELGVTRANKSVPPMVLQRIFELPAPSDEESTTDYLSMPNGDAVVIELLRVNAGDYKSLPLEEQVQLQRLLSGEFGSLIDNEFQTGLRESAEITVL
ncbi:MAG: SurA N-terminal domain-containing protein [Halioglobus sp.]